MAWRPTKERESTILRGMVRVSPQVPPPTSRPSSGSRPRPLGPADTARSPGGPWRQPRAEAACSLGWRPRCPGPRPRPDRPGFPGGRGARRNAGGCPWPAPRSPRSPRLPQPAAPPAGHTAGLPAPAGTAALGPRALPWPLAPLPARPRPPRALLDPSPGRPRPRPAGSAPGGRSGLRLTTRPAGRRERTLGGCRPRWLHFPAND